MWHKQLGWLSVILLSLSLSPEGIEKVEIIQMDNAVIATPEMDKNVLDITVTCQGRWIILQFVKLAKILHPLKAFSRLFGLTGASSSSSLPKEVCSVILDAECMKPIHTACNMVEPSKECQMVLRHFFNDSGVYCVNVSMANDVSLAATSAKINVDIGAQQWPLYTSPRMSACLLCPASSQCDLCFRFRSVLAWHHRHGYGCPGSRSSSRDSRILLQVRTDFPCRFPFLLSFILVWKKLIYLPKGKKSGDILCTFRTCHKSQKKLHHPLHDTPSEWLGLCTNTAQLALEKDLIWFCILLNRRFKSYRPLKEDMIMSAGQQPGRAHSCSGASTFWSLLNRRGAVDNCPLLQERPVWAIASITWPNAKPGNLWFAS